MKRGRESSNSNGNVQTSKRLLERYNSGYSTASELMLSVLTLTDKGEVRQAIDAIPKQILDKLENFVGYYNPDIKVFNGPAPNIKTIAFVRKLLTSRKSRPA